MYSGAIAQRKLLLTASNVCGGGGTGGVAVMQSFRQFSALIKQDSTVPTNNILPLRGSRSLPATSLLILSSSYQPHRFNTTKSSTKAIEYKLRHPRKKIPPLPQASPPTPSAEEAVTNILYNTPPPPFVPEKRHVLNSLVQNEPGVLSKVSGIFAARGFNIDSLVVASTEVRDLSRMTIVLRGQDVVIEQARRQLEDLVAVWAVLDYTETNIVERELLLAKVSILGPERLHEQLTTLKHDVYHDEFVPETDLEENSNDANVVSQPSKLSPSSVLRRKHAHLDSISNLAKSFGGRVVDISASSVIVELSAKPTRIDAFLKLIKPFGILESARSGMMALPRTPIEDNLPQEEEEENEDGRVDATMLPPG